MIKLDDDFQRGLHPNSEQFTRERYGAYERMALESSSSEPIRDNFVQGHIRPWASPGSGVLTEANKQNKNSGITDQTKVSGT